MPNKTVFENTEILIPIQKVFSYSQKLAYKYTISNYIIIAFVILHYADTLKGFSK